jgi:2,4-dienoyl-CoA reductase-like NADH-dependent reductase (Old Yellow Enzyme family)
LATVKGAVTQKLVDYYAKRSGALGLLIVEHSYVSVSGRLSKKQLGIYDDKLIPGLKKLASRIHATGTPVVIQINHAGSAANRDITGTEPVGPSATENARELTKSEIELLAKHFAEAAGRAMSAGFDGVEVHGAHGFLLNQFYSPLTNKRQDEYGGSLENRTRFPLDVVEKVKEKVKDRLLLYRLGSDDLDPKGTQIEDSTDFAVKLERSGVDIIDVSGGLCGSRPDRLQSVKGYFVPQAQAIKKVVKVPVVGVGGITEPTYADRLVREGKVDLVAVGRGLYKDPQWAQSAVKTLKA